MAIIRRKKTASVKEKKTTKVKKRYVDGKLEFKNKPMLDYHLELKELKKEGLIKSFLVPTISNIEKNKYGAVKVMIDDHVFDSTMESKYYIYLLKQMQDGEIKSFELQPAYELVPSFKKVINGKNKTFRKMEYVADFLITDKNNEEAIIDVKGTLTEVFKIKRKLFEYVHADKTLRCVQLKRNQWIDV